MMKYKLSDFDFSLPEELIAQKPASPRDSAKLLVLNRNNEALIHEKFRSLVDYLHQGDVLVLNNSKVFPARLFGKKRKTGGEIEVFLHKKINDNTWECLLRGRVKEGLIIDLGKKLSACVEKINNDGTFLVSFNQSGLDFFKTINKIGRLPLPPYIKRAEKELADLTNYQTVYADQDKVGSVAAPTAGLHFTKRLLNELKSKGVIIEYITLHVGLGTFSAVKTENILEHKMHSEYVEIGPETIKTLKLAKAEKRRIIAVGTTSCRSLESWGQDSCPDTFSKWTDIFIYPGYKFLVVDALITNFHLPKSSLLMLVSALAGFDRIKSAYQEAIDLQYHFFSYGDAMLII